MPDHSRRYDHASNPKHIIAVEMMLIKKAKIDLKLDNIMVKVEVESILARDARDEYYHPLPQSHRDDRIIYLSRNNYGPSMTPTGIIQITDFSCSKPGNIPQTEDSQVEVYRAPETILGAGATYATDIWNLGVMVRLSDTLASL